MKGFRVWVFVDFKGLRVLGFKTLDLGVLGMKGLRVLDRFGVLRVQGFGF